MLSYRHAYHAGNHADVLKHSVLALILESLQRKQAPYCYIDTHAGAGRYNLASREAVKVGEFRAGIGRVWPHAERPAALARYFASRNRRKIFSTVMMASSTTTPSTAARPPSVIVFSVTPK